MMVAGIGSRKDVTAGDVRAAIDAALAARGVALSALSALATAEAKREEAGIFNAGRELALPVIVVADDALRATGTLSHSDLSQSRAGTPSVSEASALVAAGKDAKLLGPRTVLGPVTCAIAIGGGAA